MPDGYARARGADIVNPANIITFGRLCAVPVAISLTLRSQFGAAFGLFALAGISDAVDGWLARRRGGSALGAMLDPLADKALLVSMFITLAAVGVLPDWLAILVVFRDAVIIGGLLLSWHLAIPVRMRPLKISKLNTAMQIVLVAVALLSPMVSAVRPLLAVLVWAVAASTLLSGAAYVWVVGRRSLP